MWNSGRLFRSREVSGRFRDGFGCPRPNFRRRKTKDLCATCESIWASELHFARVPTTSFFGVILPMKGPILEGPRGQNLYCCMADLAPTIRWPRWRRRGLPIRPYLHARISRITVVEHLPQTRLFVKENQKQIRYPRDNRLLITLRPYKHVLHWHLHVGLSFAI